MRRSCHGKDDWVDIKWKGGEITPIMQQDTFSCTVFVMQMAKEAQQNFSNIPSQTDIETSQKHMEQLRKEMAEDILKMSEFNKAALCVPLIKNLDVAQRLTGLNVFHANGGSMCCA
ncbi:uncharacterized protein wu:fc27b11 [Oncorhynchus tshawytscha]|uniref:uncharacterized protein wu:fc27b11 n=1 Tax=Oncorhynchus tshawytscha TaxID=74940 RepID=UPI001C3CE55B|nr:uncharacterized protein wu:fc27b11 [Oncorhynchus tshawytscha]